MAHRERKRNCNKGIEIQPIQEHKAKPPAHPRRVNPPLPPYS